MIASIHAATLRGAGPRGHLEVHVGYGLPAFTVVGLPDESCREARDRVRAAIPRPGSPGPRGRSPSTSLHRTSARPAPASTSPSRSASLVATEMIPTDAIEGLAFAGELGLDGTSGRPRRRPDRRASAPSTTGGARPRCRRGSGRRARGRPVSTLRELVPALIGDARGPTRRGACHVRRARARPTSPTSRDSRPPAWRSRSRPPAATTCCWSGRPARARRCSPDGCPACCPTSRRRRAADDDDPLGRRGALPEGGLVRRPPFRAPHHTSSLGSLVGGGTPAATGRDLPRPPRRPVPRRDGPVRAEGARRPARSARGRARSWSDGSSRSGSRCPPASS